MLNGELVLVLPESDQSEQSEQKLCSNADIVADAVALNVLERLFEAHLDLISHADVLI